MNERQFSGAIRTVLLFLILCALLFLIFRGDAHQSRRYDYQIVSGSGDVLPIFIKSEEESGWELVTVTPDDKHIGYAATMRRPTAQR